MAEPSLHRPAGTLASENDPVALTPEQAGWTFSGLRVVRLGAGERRELRTGPDEVAVLPLSAIGLVVEADGQRFELAGRTSVFSRVTDFAYVGRDTTMTLVAAGEGGEVALPSARCETRRPARYGPAEEVPVEVRGAGPATRQVTNFMSPESWPDAETLMCVELLTPDGNWSSYPPHKHDASQECPVENEEIYYFRIGRAGEQAYSPDGIGLHRLYTGDGSIDETVEVRDGDVFLIPKGYHGPCVAAPGYTMYYLNVLAGPTPGRSMAFCDDPAHHWVRESWDGMATDPRCPMTSAVRGRSTATSVPVPEGPLLYLDRDLPDVMMVALAPRARLSGPAPEAMAAAEGIVAGASRWDGERMDRCPAARVISRSGIGYDNVDVAAATVRGIAVCIAPDAPTVSTAEHAVALLLAAAKRLSENQARLRAGPGDHFGLCRSVELDGSTLGLVGYGRIARRVGRTGAALGMTVIAHDPYLEPAADLEVELVSFDDLLVRSDAISVHAPLTDGTRGLFGTVAFARVRPGVIFVNTARGPLVDQEALVAALDAGRVGAAALDVTDPEPLPVDHPLLGRDDVLVTPHIASATGAGRLRLYEHAVENALGVLAGLPPATCHVVNPEVLGGAR